VNEQWPNLEGVFFQKILSTPVPAPHSTPALPVKGEWPAGEESAVLGWRIWGQCGTTWGLTFAR
jgi:hypothetical protein